MTKSMYLLGNTLLDSFLLTLPGKPGNPVGPGSPGNPGAPGIVSQGPAKIISQSSGEHYAIFFKLCILKRDYLVASDFCLLPSVNIFSKQL